MKRTERDKLLRMLRDNKAIIEYQKIEQSINKSPYISSLLAELYELQKKMIIKKTIAEKERYEAILHEIEKNPEITHYLDLQGDINLILQALISEIEAKINL